LRLANFYAGQDKFDLAKPILDEIEQKNADNPRVLQAVGQVYVGQANYAVAAEKFEKLVALAPIYVDGRLFLARAQASAGDLDSARKTYEAVLGIEPINVDAHRALVEIDVRKGDLDMALQTAVALRDKLPDQAIGYQLVAGVSEAKGQFPEAVEAYEAAWGKQQSGPLAIALYRARTRVMGKAEALQALKGWVDGNPDDAKARLELAGGQLEVQQYNEALTNYESLNETSPGHPIILNNLAWLYQERNDSRGLEYGELALKAAPGQPAILDTVGWILVQRGEAARGVELLADASEKLPKDPEVQFHYAFALKAVGKIEDAKSRLGELLKSHSGFSSETDARALLKELGG
jgi:putative PEP-CTERM system TPR-repeat lipoprotein